MQHLCIATWNTWKNEGAYRQRLPAMADALNVLAADVVLLQECFRTTSDEGVAADTCAYLAQATGLHPVYAPARRKPRDFEGERCDSESGHAVLSRWPVRDIERLVLPTTVRGGERIALIVRVMLERSSVLLACVHFSHVRSEQEIRRQQFERVMSRLAEMSAPGEPAFITGDFNCARGDAEWESAEVPAGWCVCDGIDELGLAEPTHPLPATFEYPGRRIDFILGMHRIDHPSRTLLTPVDAGIQCGFQNQSPRSEKPSPCPLPGGEGSTAILPSDHALVWTDWEIADAR